MNSVLANQTAVITGASSGIGRATARALRQAGMKLLLTARRRDRLEALASELGETEIVTGDILDPGLPARLVETAIGRFGRCDAVFNNAGTIEVGAVGELDIDKMCEMVRINVEAAFRMAYVAAGHFKKTGSGHLVNTSSILGTKVRPTAGAYAGTKYAIEALTEALRMEFAGTAIRISCIEPGLVLTELHDHWKTHPRESMNIKNPLRPEDIANAIRFLLEQPAHVRIPRLMIMPGEHAM
jgi:NADP-dependent 3-hydroxy acid dehydrogenase YdfG